jgi:hypothetical protein
MRNLLSLFLTGLLAATLCYGQTAAAEPETGEAAKAAEPAAGQPAAGQPGADQTGGARVPDPEKRAKAQTQSMQKALGLDAEQSEKVEEINLKFVQGMQGLRASTKQGPERTKEARRLQTERTDAIKGILTKEQLEKYQSATSMMRQKKRGKKKAAAPQG